LTVISVVIGPTYGDRRDPAGAAGSGRRTLQISLQISLDPPRQEHHNADNL
jgi:hypothetical protein